MFTSKTFVIRQICLAVTNALTYHYRSLSPYLFACQGLSLLGLFPPALDFLTLPLTLPFAWGWIAYCPFCQPPTLPPHCLLNQVKDLLCPNPRLSKARHEPITKATNHRRHLR